MKKSNDSDSLLISYNESLPMRIPGAMMRVDRRPRGCIIIINSFHIYNIMSLGAMSMGLRAAMPKARGVRVKFGNWDG